MDSVSYFTKLGSSFLFLITLLVFPWLCRSNVQNIYLISYGAFWLSLILALVSLWTLPRRRQKAGTQKRLVWTAVPLFLAILWGILQTVPFSEEKLRHLSPGIGELAQSFLPVSGSEEARIEDQFISPEERENFSGLWPSTMSIYPVMTRENLSTLIMAVIVFITGGILFQTNRERLFFWRLIAINGVLLALFVILTRTFPHLPYYQEFWPTAACGPYINRNNMAGYLTLSLAPAVCFLAYRLLEGMRQRDYDRNVYDGICYSGPKNRILRLFGGVSDFFNLFSRQIVIELILCGIILAGTAVTLSRGGTLAAFFSFILAASFLAARRRTGFYLIPLWTVLLVALFFIFWFGMKEKVQDRMNTLVGSEAAESAFSTNSRLTNWQGALKTACLYHERGSGLGTYFIANWGNDQALVTQRFFQYAENQGVETLVTAGIPGIFLLFSELGLFIFLTGRALRKRSKEALASGEGEDTFDKTFALGIGMVVLLAGQIIAGSFDFGLCLAPNAVLMAAICGSFAGGEFQADGGDEDVGYLLGDESKGLPSKIMISLFAIPLLIGGVYSYREAKSQIDTQFQIASYDLSMKSNVIDDKYWDQVIGIFSESAQARPTDISIHLKLADIYLLRFREGRRKILKEMNPNFSDEELLHLSSLEVVYQEIYPLAKRGMVVIPRRFRRDPLVQENLVPALRELLIARRICPLYPELHANIAILTALLAESPEIDAVVQLSIQRSLQVGRYQPRNSFLIGVIQYISGRKDEACGYWRQTLRYAPQYLENVAVILSAEQIKETLTERLSGVIDGDWKLMEKGIELFPQKSNSYIYGVFLDVMAEYLVNAADKTTGEYYRNCARFHLLSGNLGEVSDFYEKALEIEPFNAPWLYEYGIFLYNEKQADKSIEIFERALKIDPKNKRYQNGLERAQRAKTKEVFEEFEEPTVP